MRIYAGMAEEVPAMVVTKMELIVRKIIQTFQVNFVIFLFHFIEKAADANIPQAAE